MTLLTPAGPETRHRTSTPIAKPPQRPACSNRDTHQSNTATVGRSHAFAVSTLLDAHRQRLDVDARIAVLSTHLGHIGPAHTYWYLTITPELADAVSERAALYYQGGSFR